LEPCKAAGKPRTRCEDLHRPPGRAGSDFFVVTGRGGCIKDEYAILGRVRAGAATVERIAALGTESERPSQVVRIDSIRIRRAG
jgi:cyclophilin family peptidyl-prolyl cis-trans isomerase